MSARLQPLEGWGESVNGGIVSPELLVERSLPIGLDPDVDIGNTLPNDHPAWAKDVVSLSARFRAQIARIKPMVVRVLTFWDQHVRSIAIGARRMTVDMSGCYRLE